MIPSIVALFQMVVKKLDHVLKIVRNILENGKTAEEQLQFHKVCTKLLTLSIKQPPCVNILFWNYKYIVT